MNCEVAREALSARTDGEREPVPAARVDEHVGGCAACQSWYERATAQARQLRPTAPRLTAVPDSVSVGLRVAPTRPTRLWLRVALAAMGAFELALAAARGLAIHLAEPAVHEGPVGDGFLLTEALAWSSAAGLAMLITAIRPRVGGGLAALLLTCAAVQAILLIISGAMSAVTFAHFLSCLPIVVGAALAASVCRRPWSTANRAATAPALTDILLPDNARRGRSRWHLHSADNPAA